MALGRLRLLELLGRVGFHIAEAKDRGHHVRALDEGRTRACGHVGVAAGIDHHIAENGLRSSLGLADDALDGIALHDRRREPGVKPDIDARFLDEVVGHPLPAVRIEGHGIDDGLLGTLGVEVEHPPPRPAVPHLVAQDSILGRRIDGQPQRVQALHHLLGDAVHGDFLGPVGEIVEHQHHASRGQAAQVGVAFQQGHARSLTGGRNGCGQPCRSAPDHDHVALGLHRGIGSRSGYGGAHCFRNSAG